MFNDNSVPLSINIMKLKKDHNPTKKLIMENPMFSFVFELLIIDNSEHVKQIRAAIKDKIVYIKIILYASSINYKQIFLFINIFLLFVIR
jgi:hypothetical protein